MSGWLPLQSAMNSFLPPDLAGSIELDENEENSFTFEIDDMADNEECGTKVFRFIREDISNMPFCNPHLQVFCKTPILMGHGDQDDVVKLAHGENAVSALRSLDLNVSWKVYEHPGHWFCVPTTIDDISLFLKKNIDL